MSIQEAFFSVCRDARPAARKYVSLYVNIPYYGGPEEGGWWGKDTNLVAYQPVSTEEEAEAVREAVERMACDLNAEAKAKFGDQCLAECEWLEARGLDADYLPEPDGEECYSVVIEDTPGASASRGCRHYE